MPTVISNPIQIKEININFGKGCTNDYGSQTKNK